MNGISGNPFPTPFADPPGVGLSSPLVNVLWALLNLVIGYFLFRGGKVSSSRWSQVVFFIGIVLISIQLAVHFSGKAAH